MKARKTKPDIVSVQLAPQAKAALDQACKDRGMTIKSLLGRLLRWFNSMSRTEQSIILGQIEADDVGALLKLLTRRRKGAAPPRTGARRAGR